MRKISALPTLMGLFVLAAPMAAMAQDSYEGPNRFLAPSAPVLANILYDVAYAASFNKKTEMVISIKNPNTVSCDVQVEWIFGFGAGQTGVSGPTTLAPQTTAEFTTANSSELIAPFVLNTFRDTTTDFEGSARIRSNCSSLTKLGVNALLVTGIGGTTGLDYAPVSVARPTGRVGD